MVWNLRQKIWTGYLAVMLLAGAVLTLAMIHIIRLGDASDAILQENYQSILAAEEMLNALDRQDNSSLQLVLGIRPDRLAQFSEAEQRFLLWLARAKDNVTIAGEAEILDRIEDGYTQYLYELTYFRQAYTGDRSDGETHYAEKLAPKARAVRIACKELHELNRRTMEASSARAARVAKMAVWSTSIFAAVVFGAAMVFSIWLAARIVRPITVLTRATEKVAAGEYDVSIQAETTDEIGQLAQKFNVMVTKLRAYRELDLQRILGEQKKRDTILQTIDDGVLVVDSQRKISSANPAALRALGVDDRQLDGIEFRQVVKQENLLQAVEDTLRSGKPHLPNDPSDVVTISQSEGHRLHYEFTVTPILDHEEEVLGVVILFRDVTKLKELDRLKTEFVMTASHELRTPLTSIGMSIELLRERLAGRAEDADQQLLDVAHEEVDRLRRLVEELLNLSKIESGRLEMDMTEVCLADIVRTATAPFQSQAEEKGLELSIATPDQKSVVKADANKLAWVVTNLLGNALRYAKTRIWVSVESAGRWVNIYVRDDGPGIPYDLQARIFDRFVQVGGDDKIGGAGLGLAIAKEIVRAHSGHIWVESEPEKGSLFTVTLPAIKPEDAQR